MSDCKTVTHEGSVYEIGKVYSFSHDHKYKCERRLKGIEKSSAGYPIVDHAGVRWRYIEAVDSSELGTITPAPVELVEGNAYMFNIRGDEVIGLYDLESGTLTGGRYCLHCSAVSNIRLMVVEKK